LLRSESDLNKKHEETVNMWGYNPGAKNFFRKKHNTSSPTMEGEAEISCMFYQSNEALGK
jgi:hypothetical protein